MLGGTKKGKINMGDYDSFDWDMDDDHDYGAITDYGDTDDWD